MTIKSKPRIFIAAHYMELGGAEISLIGLLNALDPARVDVDLFVYSHQGPLMKFIPSWVKILPEIPEYAQIERPLIQVFKDGFWRQGIARLKAKIRFNIWLKKQSIKNSESIYDFIAEEIVPTLPSLQHFGVYDLAINFIGLKNLIINKVSANKTITWIHTDLCAVNICPDIEYKYWNAYDYIASISPEVTQSFIKLFPNLASKVIEIENILSPAFVKKRAEEFEVKF